MKKIFYSLIACFFIQIAAYAQGGWVIQNSGTNQDLWAIYFQDQNKGWAAGKEGTLIKTTNGGATWDPVTTNTDAWFSSIFFLDHDHGWVVGPDYTWTGASGILLKTTNGGEDWILQTFPERLFEVIFINQNIGWAVGSYGEVYPNYYGIVWKTTNGGETWIEKTTSPAPSSYWDMCFVNETTGWVVGENNPTGPGIVKKTTDGGETWFEQTIPFQYHLEAINFIDEQFGWILGSYLLLHTTNGGDDWIIQYSDPSIGSEDMFFVDENVGWVTHGILKTTDSGINWSAQNNPTSNSLASIFFLNSTEGWIVGYNGTILHTTNGGNPYFVDLLLPNGGEEIASNSNYEITWSSENVDSVNIYLSLDNGVSWSDIVIDYPSYNSSNNGFIWNVPDTTSDQCLIKIEDSSDPFFYDISENTFKIIELPRFTYFPLSVGNIWYFSSGHDGVIKYKVEVEKDTLLDDNNTYAKLRQLYTPNDSLLYVFYLREENNKIIRYPNYIVLNYDMNIGDSVTSVFEYPYPSVLDDINLNNVFGRYLSTYYFSFTQYDYYSYTDSIGFNTWVADTWTNYFPEYLLGCIIDGVSYGLVSVEEENESIPVAFLLSQNYPNPFNPSTLISYQLPVTSNVTLKVYDILGREVATLVNEEKPAGSYEVQFDSHSGKVQNLTSGIYFYQINAGDPSTSSGQGYSETKKMILIK